MQICSDLCLLALFAVQIGAKNAAVDDNSMFTVCQGLAFLCLFISVSRGEQERREVAEETSILCLTDQAGFPSVRDTLLLIHTQTSQRGWHNRNTAPLPEYPKGIKLRYIKIKTKCNLKL